MATLSQTWKKWRFRLMLDGNWERLAAVIMMAVGLVLFAISGSILVRNWVETKTALASETAVGRMFDANIASVSGEFNTLDKPVRLTDNRGFSMLVNLSNFKYSIHWTGKLVISPLHLSTRGVPIGQDKDGRIYYAYPDWGNALFGR